MDWSGSGLMANFDYDQAGEDAVPTAPSTWAERLLSATGQRRRAVEHYGSVQSTVDYDYDTLQRLTKETISGAQTAVVDYGGTGTGIGYDPVGNRRSRQVTSGSLPGVSSYTCDTFNERDEQNPATRFTYDANGNTMADATQNGATCIYDAENHLIKRMGGGLPTVELSYDVDGNRVAKTVTPTGGVPTTTRYLVEDRKLTPTGYVLT